jgi:CRP-like cAMP-binding protein
MAFSRRLVLLNSIPMFTPLSVAAKEYVATNLVPLAAAHGTEIIRKGDVGDRFYIIASGQAEVRTDGHLLSVHGPGEYFGEIALPARITPHRDRRRARRHAVVFARPRRLLAAVTGHPLSLEAGEGIVRKQLAAA